MPRLLARLRQRLRDLVAWEARDRDIDDEMQFHVESLARQYRNDGLSAEEARLAAQRQFGSALQMRDRGHDVRGAGRVEALVREARHAGRRLLRTPAFTLAAVSTLALAIGANAAIFTIVHRVVLNPLPYPDSDRLVDLDHGASAINIPGGMGMKVGLYAYYAERARTLDGIAIYVTVAATLAGDAAPERIRVTRATPALASVLGVPPAAGRWFTEAESVPGGPAVAVLSHGLWTRRYGADPGIIGRQVTINAVPTEVVGVMPAGHAFPDSRVDLWVPERLPPSPPLGIWTHRGIARMRDGVTVDAVRADIDRLIQDLPQAFPDDPLLQATGPEFGTSSTARTLKEATVGTVRGTLWFLLAAVGVVLLVAAANVANLFLVRADARQREVAVRRALGAGAAGIARLFLTESVLLSVAAGAAGLFIASGAVRALVAAAPATLPRLTEVRLDPIVVSFTLVLSVLAGLAFGSMPLLGGGARIAGALGDGGRRLTASRQRHRARHLLMAVQVALALVLVAASGLLVRSFWNLRGVDPGFDTTAAVTFGIGLPRGDYPDRDTALAAHQAIIDRIAALPEVASVSAASCLPLDGPCFGNGVVIEGRGFPEDPSAGSTSYRAIAGAFHETMGIRLLRGRSIERRDVERREPVAVVDETFADLVFPGEDPIGRRVSWSLPPENPGETPNHTWLTIVGIVSSTPVRALGEPVRIPQLYMPMSITGQFDAPPWEYIGPTVTGMNYVVRARVLSSGLLPSIRAAIDTVDPGLAMAPVSTLEERLDRASASMAFTMALITIAAGVALVLGLIGIYGVVSYVVSQRTNEIGVRMALGAEPVGVATSILRQGGTVACVGIVAGLAVALAGGRLIESLLYGVSARDPLVFGASTLALLTVALLACWLPARRAARISPVDALRAD